MSSIEFRMLAMASEGIETIEPSLSEFLTKAHLQAVDEGSSVMPIHIAISILENTNGIASSKVDAVGFRAAWENLRDN